MMTSEFLFPSIVICLQENTTRTFVKATDWTTTKTLEQLALHFFMIKKISSRKNVVKIHDLLKPLQKRMFFFGKFNHFLDFLKKIM